MKILFIGDLVGKAGRRALAAHLERLVDRYAIDYTIANVENVADGLGVTADLAEETIALGVDCLTSGNHIWDKREIREYIKRQPRLLRPLNYPRELPGSGIHVGETASGIRVAVLNAMGRVFMPPIDDPFRLTRDAVDEARRQTPVIIVDMHGEASSEKIAMGWFLDGEVSAVLGTHTHIQTADERVLPGGTAYITDVGMTGPYDSVIGMDKQIVLSRFLTLESGRMTSARGDPRLCGVVLDIDEATGRARSIERLMLGAPPGRDDA